MPTLTNKHGLREGWDDRWLVLAPLRVPSKEITNHLLRWCVKESIDGPSQGSGDTIDTFKTQSKDMLASPLLLNIGPKVGPVPWV